MEDWPVKTTLWRLKWRNDSIRSVKSPFIPLFLSLHRWISCQTLSNAFDKSNKIQWLCNEGLVSNVLKKILSVIEISWLTQESFGLKPDWVLFRVVFYQKFKNSIKNELFKNFRAYRSQGCKAIVIDVLFINFLVYWNNVTHCAKNEVFHYEFLQ